MSASGLKPTNIDAQRVLAILQELKERLTLMSVVTPQVLEGLQGEDGSQAVESLGPECFKCFCEQIRLEEQYLVLNNTEGGVVETNTDEMKNLLEKLSKNTIDLCRKLKINSSNAIGELRNFQENRPQQVLQLIRTLGEMEDLTLKRLSTTVEEERSRQELLEHYINKEEAATKKRIQLEKHLAQVRRDREKAQTSRTEVLTKLKADLLDVKDSTEHKSRTLREKFDSRMKELSDRYQKKEEQLLKEISQNKEGLRTMLAASQDDEIALRRKKKRGETDLEELVQNYDSVMRASSEEYETSLKEIRKEQQELAELEEHFAKLDAEQARQDRENIYKLQSTSSQLDAEQARQDREKEMEKLRDSLLASEKERLGKCASFVQAYWKGLVGREDFIKLRKSKKGKKGGGKKGKK